MKPAPFAYVRPSTVDDTVAELADGSAKILAGGQSLVPVLAMRLARPPTLVDINRVEELNLLRCVDGMVEIGATVRQRRMEREPLTSQVPLLGKALPWIGHRELRSRGTMCGSLAHADPGAELPAVASCIGAEFDILGPNGRRTIAAQDFFTGALTTAVEAEELLTAVRFPVAGAGDGFGFAEIARRHGDFALAGVAVHVHSEDGTVRAATVAAFGVSDRPVTREVSALLTDITDITGTQRAELVAALGEPAAELAEQLVDTEGDAHASRGYRARLLGVLIAREVAGAYLESVVGERK